MSDIFSEVEEEFRNERLKSAWKRFGFIPIGLAVLIVLATAAFKGYEFWQSSVAARDGDRFLAAVELANSGDHEGAREALLALANETGSGYAVVARFRAATEAGNAGDVSGSIETFRALAADPSVPDAYQTLAEIRAAYLAVDSESYGDLLARVGALADEADGWSAYANEILGLSAYQAGDLETARGHFEAVLSSGTVAQPMAERVRMMDGLVRSKLGDPLPEAEANFEAEADAAETSSGPSSGKSATQDN